MKFAVSGKRSYLAIWSRLREVAREDRVEFISFWIVRNKGFSSLLFKTTDNAQFFKSNISDWGIFNYLAAFQWRLLQTALNSILNFNICICLRIFYFYFSPSRWNTKVLKYDERGRKWQETGKTSPWIVSFSIDRLLSLYGERRDYYGIDSFRSLFRVLSSLFNCVHITGLKLHL